MAETTISIGDPPIFARVVDFEEAPGPAGLEALVTYHVAWPDRIKFLKELFGYVDLTAVPPEIILAHLCPDPAYADVGLQLFARPDGFRITPVGPLLDSEAGWFKVGKIGTTGNGLARIQVRYAPEESVDFTEDLDGGGQYITLPGSSFTLETSGRAIEQDVGFFMCNVDITRNYDRLKFETEEAFPYIGHVNLTTFRSLPPQSVLLAKVRSRHRFNLIGGSENSMQLAYVYRPVEWNKVWDRVIANWDWLVPRPYPTAEFNNLYVS